MEDVAIVGVGLHPFGRFPGKTAIDMGADAIHSALRALSLTPAVSSRFRDRRDGALPGTCRPVPVFTV